VPSRPTVVVADDHRRMLDAVSNLLSDDFCLVAAVTDGRQAVDAVLRLDPDIAVLDITMPELDGFRTAQALKHAGARAKMVFLTLHDADEYVRAALRSGAQGYVLKARMEADLRCALRHALAGRNFLPSLTSLSTMAGDTGAHTLHLRAGDDSFHDDVVEMLLAAIARDEMAVVLGTAGLRASIASRLNAAGCDVAAMRGQGRYCEFDAAGALSKVMRNGRPDRSQVAKMVDDLERLRLGCGPRGRSRVTLFGEMAGLLLQDGHLEAAVQLEQTWDELTRTLPYLTICSYPARTLHPERYSDVWMAMCAQHSAICHAARLQ
jgi:DNA-binding NarL/FixJ family response regulator